jgi:purine-binding chemotaxis protein CheW
MKNDSIAYLTFGLGDEKFAIPVELVQEVVEFGQVTKVPNTPDYILGIINLRGRVLPLLDTKLKLNLSATEKTTKSRIMVLNLTGDEDKNLHVGALVDVAREVIEIKPDEIQKTTEFENSKTEVPITGIVNRQGDITMIIDITKVFSLNEIINITPSLN